MTTIYLVRHCETVANETHLLQGSCDYEISKRGKRQLELLKKRFANNPPYAIYSSPQGRAVKTALALKGDNHNVITLCPDLRELACGVHESTKFGEYLKTDPEMYDVWHNKPYLFEPQGGEKAKDSYERIYNAVMDIVKANDGKSVAVVSHGFVIRCLLTKLIHNDITKLSEVIIPCNTSVTQIEFYDDGTHKIIKYNDAEHLPDELKTFFVAK